MAQGESGWLSQQLSQQSRSSPFLPSVSPLVLVALLVGLKQTSLTAGIRKFREDFF